VVVIAEKIIAQVGMTLLEMVLVVGFWCWQGLLEGWVKGDMASRSGRGKR